MRILAFTDIHGSKTAFRIIKKKIIYKKPDLLVCAGDISLFEHGFLSIMRKLNKLNRLIIMVHGNHEDEHIFIKYSKLFKNIIFIHKRHFIKDDALFLGYGGGGFSVVDKEFEKIAKTKFKKIIQINKDKKIILVTHPPPYNTRLDRLFQGHCGNKSIRKFVEKNHLDLLICGHLHENFGKEDMIAQTKIVNPGPYGKIIDI